MSPERRRTIRVGVWADVSLAAIAEKAGQASQSGRAALTFDELALLDTIVTHSTAAMRAAYKLVESLADE